jgi:hypothetical protein
VRGAFGASTLAILLLVLTACAREDEQLRQLRQTFTSLAATVQAIDDAWLAGDLSGTATANALDQTLRLVEQQRASLAASPQMLADPRGAELAEGADRLSRLLAVTIRDVRAADAAGVRRSLAAVPFAAGSS